MEENLNVGSATQENVVDSQQTEQATNTNEPVNARNGEVTTPVVESKPVQTPEQNALYAQIRREAEQKAQDKVIAELGYTYNNQPITTYAQYQQALQEQQRQQEAQQRNIDPEFYGQFKSMEEKLNAIEREKTLLTQDTQLSNDPKIGELYKEWKNDVHELANQYNIDYDTAMTVLTRERLSDIISKNKIQTEQEVIKGLNQNAQTTPGALGNGLVDHKTDVSSMSKADFEKLVNGIKRGEITSI